MAEKVIKLGVHNTGSEQCPMQFLYLAANVDLIDPRTIPPPSKTLAITEEWPGHYIVRHSANQLVLGFPDGNEGSLRNYAAKLSAHLGDLAVDNNLYAIESETEFGFEDLHLAPGFDTLPEAEAV